MASNLKRTIVLDCLKGALAGGIISGTAFVIAFYFLVGRPATARAEITTFPGLLFLSVVLLGGSISIGGVVALRGRQFPSRVSNAAMGAAIAVALTAAIALMMNLEASLAVPLSIVGLILGAVSGNRVGMILRHAMTDV